jgi:hypothetical protein
MHTILGLQLFLDSFKTLLQDICVYMNRETEKIIAELVNYIHITTRNTNHEINIKYQRKNLGYNTMSQAMLEN